MSGGATLVIGGTGKVGGRLVRRLVAAGLPVSAASRSGQAPEGATPTRFDWFDQGSWGAALEGATGVFMTAPVGASDPIEAMQPFVERAIDAGVRRFVLLSSSLIEEGGPAMGAVHAVLRRSAPEWAVLRPSWFMENFTIDPHLSSIRYEGLIYSASGPGRVPFIATADIAEVGFRTLTDPTPVNGDLVLTGPDLLSYADVAKLIGDARGTPVHHQNLNPGALAGRLEGFGIPGPFAAMLAQLDQAIAAGAEDRTTAAVETATGRPPIRLADFVAEREELWRAERQ